MQRILLYWIGSAYHGEEGAKVQSNEFWVLHFDGLEDITKTLITLCRCPTMESLPQTSLDCLNWVLTALRWP